MAGALSPPVLVSIGATHPWNIAGLGLDAQVAREYGMRSVAVVAGVTAQDESGLHAKFAVPAAVVRAQLESLPDGVAAFRIGAIFEEENVREVAAFLGNVKDVPIVVDPVFGATLGGEFVSEQTFGAFREHMLRIPGVLTPNAGEAERLSARSIGSEDEMVSAARALRALGPSSVLLKGGHLEGDPVDVLVTAHETKIYRAKRLPWSMRGTGCALACALACELARGLPVAPAVESARAYVRTKMEARIPYGSLRVAF